MRRLSFAGCLHRQRPQLCLRPVLSCRRFSSNSAQQQQHEQPADVKHPSSSSSSSAPSSSPAPPSHPSHEPLPLRRPLPSRLPSPSAVPTSASASSPSQRSGGSRSSSRPPYVSKSKGPEYFVDVGADGLLEYAERPYSSPRLNSAKGAYTPLAEELHEQIKVRGPLTVYDFMYQCMQNPKHGYYTTKQQVIGGKQPLSASASASASAPATASASASASSPTSASASPSTSASSSSSSAPVPVGDFITSPEVSQLFGEMVGVWLVSVWQQLGQPASFHLVELGPGRGTLMQDVLRVVRHFPAMHSAVEVQLVESSSVMRELQRETLGVRLSADSSPFFSPSLLLPDAASSIPPSRRQSLFSPPPAAFADTTSSGFTADRVRVTWHSSLASLPSSRPVLFLCHEFLDALPVYQFQYTADRGWLELLVDADYSTESPYHFRYCLSPVPTPAVSQCVAGRQGRDGEQVEMGLLAMTVVEDLTLRIGRQGGAALVIDYGYADKQEVADTPLTLQAVQSHRHVHPFHEPGLSDLSALVDFSSLSATVERTARIRQLPVHALPVISQHSFLRNMGIAERLDRLVAAVEETGRKEGKAEEQMAREVDDLAAGATRLVSEQEMGGLFKVLSVVHEKVGADVAAWDATAVREKIRRDRQDRDKGRQQPA